MLCLMMFDGNIIINAADFKPIKIEKSLRDAIWFV